MMKGFRCLYLALVYVCFTSQTHAGIAVLPNLINIQANTTPRSDVTVINEGDEEAYIKITPHIIRNPGTKFEQKISIHNPEKYGLLVTPQQLIIPAKQQRLVRLMLTHPLTEEEQIYVIDIVPIPREIIPLNTFTKSNKHIGLQMLVGYGVLTMVRPIHPQLDIRLQRIGRKLLLHNKGNANVELSNIKQCIHKRCTTVKNFIRLYAGTTNEIALNSATPAIMSAQLLDEQKMLTSN